MTPSKLKALGVLGEGRGGEAGEAGAEEAGEGGVQQGAAVHLSPLARAVRGRSAVDLRRSGVALKGTGAAGRRITRLCAAIAGRWARG